MDNYISFPNMGSYHIPIERFLNLTIKGQKVKAAPPITKKTLDLGTRYSPDFVCVPFKYTLGNCIEALKDGAAVLMQIGGGCRFGYYGEVQEQILKNLGFKFKFINLFAAERYSTTTIYEKFKDLGCTLAYPKFIYYLLFTLKMIRTIDKAESYIRENIGFETYKKSFDKFHKEFLNRLKTVSSISSLYAVSHVYMRRLKKIEVNKPYDIIKIGIIGELYTLMEPFSNFYIERELSKYGIMVSRHITATFLLFNKPLNRKKTLKKASKYLKYDIGADGIDSVADSIEYAKSGHDGIIHIKPFGCTPEINAVPVLQNIGRDYKIPILYLSFDSQTSETGIKTRIEAFYDMISMQKAHSL